MATDSNKQGPQGNPAPAETGNASNPTPGVANGDSLHDNRLLSGEAEKYLREVASIEDVPDPQDQQEMDDTLREESK